MPQDKDQVIKNSLYHKRIPIDYSSMKSLSVEINLCQKVFDDFKYLFAATCRFIKFVLTIPVKSKTSQAIVKALIRTPVCR